MQYAHLGRTGAKVSRLGLGTMNFGWHTDEANSHHDHGRRPRRGHQLLRHRRRLRRPVHPRRSSAAGSPGRPCRRDKVVLATKVYIGRLTDWPNTGGSVGAAHPPEPARTACAGCETDHIDLYQFHHVDRSTPGRRSGRPLDRSVRDGKVLYVGSCNFAGWHLAAGAARPPRRGTSLGLVSEQSHLQPAWHAPSSSRCRPPPGTTASA